MRFLRHRGRRRHDDRAELLDAALTSWQQGDALPDAALPADLEAMEPVGDELAAAHALDSFAASAELPREPLVAIRAAIAAREAVRGQWWRRLLVQPRLAPATVAIVAVIVSVGAVTTVRGSEEPLTHVAAAKAEEFLETAEAKAHFVQLQTASATSVEAIDAAELNKVIVEAQSAAAAARAAAQLAGGDERKVLLAQVELQQRQINALRTKVLLLAAPVLVPEEDAPGAVTTTSSSTTTEPPTTTTVKPTTTTAKPTTTTAKPTTTTEPPTTTSTTDPNVTTTTTPDTTRGRNDKTGDTSTSLDF